MNAREYLVTRCPKHGLHGERSECFVCGGPVEQVAMVDAREAAAALEAAERDRDSWGLIIAALEIRAGDAEVRAAAAEKERDEAVGIALWLAALDAVQIENRVAWVARLTASYDYMAAKRRDLFAAAGAQQEPPPPPEDPAAQSDEKQSDVRGGEQR